MPIVQEGPIRPAEHAAEADQYHHQSHGEYQALTNPRGGAVLLVSQARK
jgi:hypothetical protein